MSLYEFSKLLQQSKPDDGLSGPQVVPLFTVIRNPSKELMAL